MMPLGHEIFFCVVWHGEAACLKHLLIGVRVGSCDAAILLVEDSALRQVRVLDCFYGAAIILVEASVLWQIRVQAWSLLLRIDEHFAFDYYGVLLCEACLFYL